MTEETKTDENVAAVRYTKIEAHVYGEDVRVAYHVDGEDVADSVDLEYDATDRGDDDVAEEVIFALEVADDQEELIEVIRHEGEELPAEAGEDGDEGDAEPVADGETDGQVEPESSESSTSRDDLLDDFADAETQCELAESTVNTCKARLKDAKEEYEVSVKRLRRLARGILNDHDRPLFDKPKENAAVPEQDKPADPGAWRKAPLAELELPKGIVTKLAGESVETVGQLEDLRGKISLGEENWPKGIGPSKITTIEEKVLTWLKENQDYEESTEADASGEKEANDDPEADDKD